MNVVICSAFRNAESYISRYFSQIDALDRLLTRRGDVLSLVLGYGDSTDHTDALLFEACSGGIGARLIDCTHGGKAYTSVVDAQRFRQLAFVGNRVLANVPDDADVVVYIESDLIWEPQTIIELLNDVQWRDVVAPLIMEVSSSGFYDTFAFVKNGLNFIKAAPYHCGVNGGMIAMDSVGSCIAMRADIARRFRLPDEDVIVGFCCQVRAAGYGIYCDTSLRVDHP